MVAGSCACGETTYEFDASALQAKVACHCIPCRKTSGTTGSYNLMVSTSSFHLSPNSPKPRQYTRKGDSGSEVTYNNCAKCSTCLWVEAKSMDGVYIVKMGTVDDEKFVEGLGKPGMEIFCRNMAKWEGKVEGAKAFEGPPEE